MTDMDMKNKTGAQIFKETMDKRQPLQTVVGANIHCSDQSGSVIVTYNGGLYGVEIKVGVQSFKLGYETDDETSAYWMAFHLGNALIKTGGDFLLQNRENTRATK